MTRLKDDAYYTPPELAKALCLRLSSALYRSPGLVIEPSAGDGAFVQAARAMWPAAEVVSFDPNTDLGDQHVMLPWEHPDVDEFVRCAVQEKQGTLILGNPPYSLAEEHIRLALSRLEGGKGHGHLAVLLRASMLGSIGRGEGLWREYPPKYVWNVYPRPSFTKGGTDSAEYAMIVWHSGEKPPFYRGGWQTWR